MGSDPDRPARAEPWLRDRITRSIVGFVVAPLLIAAIGTLAARMMRDVGDHYADLASTTLPAVKALQRLQTAGLRIVASTSEHGFIRAELAAAGLLSGSDESAEEENLIAVGIVEYGAALASYEQVYSAAANAEWPPIDEIRDAGRLLIEQGRFIVALKNEGTAGRRILEEKERFEDLESEYLEVTARALQVQQEQLREGSQHVVATITEGTWEIGIASLALAFVAVVATLITSRRLDRSHAALRLAIATAEQERERATEASRAKSAFLANMSHELRTPLHGILAFTEFGLTWDASALPTKVNEYFERIQTCGQTLLRLLNDLLDLARLESGKFSFDFEPSDMGQVIRKSESQFAGKLRARKIKIRYAGLDKPLVAVVDQEKIQQVAGNLLSNALNFAPEGSVVDVSARRSPDSVRIEFRDRGPGIPTEELETVFDKFVQSSRTQSGAGGTGLGLAICRQIVEAHGGRIWATNHPSAGAVFSVLLPVSRGGSSLDL